MDRLRALGSAAAQTHRVGVRQHGGSRGAVHAAVARCATSHVQSQQVTHLARSLSSPTPLATTPPRLTAEALCRAAGLLIAQAYLAARSVLF